MEERSACKLPNAPHPAGRALSPPGGWSSPGTGSSPVRAAWRLPEASRAEPHAPGEQRPDTRRDRPAFDGAARHSDVRVRRASGEGSPGGGGLGGLGATGTVPLRAGWADSVCTLRAPLFTLLDVITAAGSPQPQGPLCANKCSAAAEAPDLLAE